MKRKRRNHSAAFKAKVALEAEAKKVMDEQGVTLDYKFGTMIEIPRAALTADQLARYARVLEAREGRPVEAWLVALKAGEWVRV